MCHGKKLDDFEKIAIKTQTKDLGEIVHYDRSCTLGFIKEKINDALTRLKKIEWIPATLQKKAMIIQSACWPLALYTADTTYIGQQHIHNLRKGALHALVGYWHTSSAYLACAMLSKHVVDPMLYVLTLCARTIRRFANVQPEDAKQMIHTAVDFSGSRPFGPASSFKSYLNVMGWTLFPDGKVTGPENISCNVLTDSTRFIAMTFHRLWTLHVIQISERKGIGNFYLDFTLGSKVFAKFSDEEQQLLKLNIVGGFQTEKRKANWSEETEGNCIFCGLPDTREHRLLECDGFKEIREKHREACSILRNERPEWVFLPLPRLHDQVFLFEQFLDTIQEKPIPELNNDVKLRFFTDGGAICPTQPRARVASWSVIQDISKSEQQQKQVADFLLTPSPNFPLFKVITVGLVKGQQTAARGELTAILTAAKIAKQSEQAISVEFVTDAAYVCAVIALIVCRTFQDKLHRLPNSDLILQLAALWDSQKFKVRKVNSHRNLDTAKDLCDLWTIAGNHCADMAATAVLQNIPQTLQQISKKIATFQDHEGRMLTTVFQYLCEFNKARVQACASRDKERANHNRNLDQPKKPPERIVGVFDSEAMGGEAFVIMRDFNPPNYFSLQTEDVPDNTFQMCLQGANLGKALFVCARQLQWPQDYKEKDKNDWGMSWLELIFNFYITTGFNMPIRTEGYGAKSVYVSYRSSEALLLPKTKRAASLQILTFRNLLQNVQTIEKQEFFPHFQESKCKSLQRLGHCCPVAGVPRRPVIPGQDGTIRAVQNYVTSLKGSAALHEVVYLKDNKPNIHFTTITEQTPQYRFNLYSQYMRKLRKQRH